MTAAPAEAQEAGPTLPTAVASTTPGSFLQGCLSLQLALATVAVAGAVGGAHLLAAAAGVAALANALALFVGLRAL